MQVNLGMHRPVQTEELLAMASWHLIQDKSGHSKNVLRAEIGRLFAGLALLQVSPSRSVLETPFLFQS